MSPYDQALIQRWNEQKDPDAFTEIVNRYAGLVYGASLRILRNPDDAEDIAQESLMRIVEAPTNVHVSLAGWLHATATRRALNRLRSERRRSAREQAYADSHSTVTDVTWDELQHIIDEVIADLPDDLRVPLVEHYLCSRTLQSIGEDLGISRQAVSRRMKKGIDQVRTMLRDKGIPVTGGVLSAGIGELSKATASASLRRGLQKAAIAGIDGKVLLPAGTKSAASWVAAPLVAAAIVGLVVLWGQMSKPSTQPPPPTSPPGPQNAATPLTATAETIDPSERVMIAQASDESENGSTSSTDDAAASTPDFTEFSLERPLPRPGVGSYFLYFDSPEAVGHEVTLTHINWHPWEKEPQTKLTFTETVPEDGIVFFKNLPLGLYHTSLRTGTSGINRGGGREGGLTESLPALPINVPLLPQSPVDFLVSDDEGNPISGAKIYVYKSRNIGNTVRFSLAPFAKSVEIEPGRYRIPNAYTHAFQCFVRAPGYAPQATDWIENHAEPVSVVLTRGGSFTCSVVDDAGNPVPNVFVHMQGEYFRDFDYARTDDNGMVEITNLRSVEYRVRVYSQNHVLKNESPTVSIREGATTDFGVLEVTSGVDIRGRVFEAETGEGIRGARLSVSADTGVAIDDLITDEDGYYIIPNASFVRYEIQRQISAGYGEQSGPRTRTLTVTQAGIEGDTDFELRKGIPVSGHVVGTDGQPGVGAMIVTTTSNTGNRSYTLADRRGRFTLGSVFEPGEIYIRAQAMGYGRKTFGPFNVTEDGLHDLVLEVPKSAFIAGNMRVNGRFAPMRTYLWARPHDPESEEAKEGTGLIYTYCGPNNGRYLLAWLTPGTYDLSIQPPNAPQSPPLATVTVREGEFIKDLFVDYYTSGSRLTGTVVDRNGSPIEFATVTASGPGAGVQAQTDENGAFAFAGLSDGLYTLTARHEDYSPVSVEGVSGSQQFVRLQMPDHGSISGQVKSARNGVPLARIRVGRFSGLLEVVPADIGSLRTFSSESGAFSLDDVNIGDTTLIVLAEDHAPALVPISNLRENENRGVGNIFLQPAAILTGRVSDANGNPIQGAAIHARVTSDSHLVNDSVLGRTGSDGEYTIDRLPAGDAQLAVTHPDYAPVDLVATLAYGATTEANVTLHGGGAISGIVYVDGTPYPGAYVALQRTEGTLGSASTRTDEYGSYEFLRIPAGDYSIRVLVPTPDGNVIRSEDYTVAVDNFGTQILDWTL